MIIVPPVTMVQPNHKSTNIHSAGFAAEVRGPLRIQFFKAKGEGLGGLGEYEDVPRALYEALLRAQSPGQFVHQNLVNHFKYRKLKIQYQVLLVITEIDANTPALPPYDFDNANPWPLGDYDSPELAMRARNAMVAVEDSTPEEIQSAEPGSQTRDAGAGAE